MHCYHYHVDVPHFPHLLEILPDVSHRFLLLCNLNPELFYACRGERPRALGNPGAKLNCRYINYVEYISKTFISRFERQSGSGVNLLAIFITKLRELIFIDRWGHSWCRTGVVLDQFVHSVAFMIIICVVELDQCWIGPREGRVG